MLKKEVKKMERKRESGGSVVYALVPICALVALAIVALLPV